ncbi:unnamed protein product [Echinostoma caproni]|uniref:RGS domain-containing protein n=1 Tax=Echinostoma caproni TaxID=27848 RepID=A0A183B391_9TREM|nr:unnamed protein product [Echinostoma caproni]
MISWCAFRPLNLEVVLFYQYLVDYGQRTQCPLIDQDLIFHLEVARFQIDISPEVCSRLLKRIQRQLSQKAPIDRKVFDEASQTIVRELLSFYAGFRCNVLGANATRAECLPSPKSKAVRSTEIPWLAAPLSKRRNISPEQTVIHK